MRHDKIIEAELFEEPFPHLIIDGFLPNDILQQLYANLPGSEVFDWEKNGLGCFGLWQDATSIEKLSEPQRRFWREFQQSFFPEDLANLLLDQFQPHLDKLYHSLFSKKIILEKEEWQSSGGLDIRNPGNRLPVHLDWPNRILSVVLYLDPSNGYDVKWGTRLYFASDAAISDPLAFFSRRQTIDKAKLITPDNYKLIDFMPNRLVVFMNSPISFHGAEVPVGSLQTSRWCFLKGINLTRLKTEELFGLPKELLY